MSELSREPRAGNGFWGAVWVTLEVVITIAVILFVFMFWADRDGLKHWLFPETKTQIIAADSVQSASKSAPKPTTESTVTASASVAAAGGTDVPTKPAALADKPVPAACTPTPVVCCPAACPEPAKKKASRPKPAAKAAARPKPAAQAPVAAAPALQPVVVTPPAPQVTVTVTPPPAPVAAPIPAATVPPATLFTTKECPKGYTDIVNVWSLTWLEQHRPDLYKEAISLIDAEAQRNSKQATDRTAFQGASFARVVGPKLRKEVKVLAPVTMDVQVYAVDAQGRSLQLLGVARVVNGAGSIKYETDPRTMDVDFIYPIHVRYPSVSGGDARTRAFGNEREYCTNYTHAAVQ